MRIGYDVDGVLASFEEAYARLIIEVTGKDLFPEPKPWYPHGDPPVWFWTQHFGYTKAEDSECWRRIKSDPRFWQNLPELPGARTLRMWNPKGHEIYFITNRMGIGPKLQTENWIRSHLVWSRPTVLVSAEKGLICKALELDAYIDDNGPNVIKAASARWGDKDQNRTRVYRLNRAYNKDMPDSSPEAPYVAVDSLAEMLRAENIGGRE